MADQFCAGISATSISSAQVAFGVQREFAEPTEGDLIHAGRILSDMHFFIQEDLRNFCEQLNPALAEIEMVHSSQSHPVRRFVWHTLLGFVFPAFLPCVFSKFMMSWPDGFTFDAEHDEVVSNSMYVELDLVKSNSMKGHVKISTEDVGAQIMLMDGRNYLLIAAVFFVVLLALRLGDSVLHWCCGACGRHLRHRVLFQLRQHVEARISTLRFISNTIYASVSWSYYALIITVALLTVAFGGVAHVASGALIGYLCAHLYLQVVNAAAGYAGGPNRDAMVAAYSGTFTAGHGGLWQRLDNWSRPVFAVTTQELMSIIAHPGLCRWSEDKLLEKMKNSGSAQTEEQAITFTYGYHRIIKHVWVLDSNKMLTLADTDSLLGDMRSMMGAETKG